MTFDMKNLTIGSARSLSLIPLLTDGQHNVPLQEIIVNGNQFLCIHFLIIAASA